MADSIRQRLMMALVDAFKTSADYPEMRRCVHDFPAPVDEIDRRTLPCVFVYELAEEPDSPDENQSTESLFNMLPFGVAIYFQYGQHDEAETILVAGNRWLAEAEAIIAEYDRSETAVSFLIRELRNEIAYLPSARANTAVIAIDYQAQYRRARLDPFTQ